MADPLEGLPKWAIPAAVIGVILLALFMSRSGGSGGGSGTVTAYSPAPSDPGLVGLSTAEVGARTTAFETLAQGVFGAEAATIASGRDTQLATISADVQNQRTAAQLAASNFAENVRQNVGLSATDAQVRIAQANAAAAATIANTNAAAATSQAHIAAKAKIGDQIVGGIKAIGSVVMGLFGKH